MDRIAPTWTAADWDHVGLLVGDGAWPLRRVLLAIDLMPDVLAEAVQGRFDAIIAYHPPIFRPLKSLMPSRRTPEGIAVEALARHIAVYSPHTALDAAPGGTNDTIAALAGIRNPVPFESARNPLKNCKLVLFVPHDHVEKVAAAIFAAGAGRIGDYDQCSFRLTGEGTFLGAESTNPAVGRRGRLERVPETRLEIILPQHILKEAIAAARRAHPYEVPAIDVYPLEPMPIEPLGQGRIGALPRDTRAETLAKQLARRIGSREAAVVGDPRRLIRRAFVCVGSAGSLPFEIPGVTLAKGDVVITGEIRHHDALRYVAAGAVAVTLGHWASERPVLGPLASRLRSELPGTAFVVSRRDRSPFTAVS